ncbi:hypothetical protein Tco_0608616 [Tanacetum coccineum]
MWSQVMIVYDKHALRGISHWWRKHQQIYRFAVIRESAVMSTPDIKSLLSPRLRLSNGIITKIRTGSLFVEMTTSCTHSKKAITTNFAFKTSKTCCFFLSTVIRMHVEDLQLGAESYQKKLNLSRPDTYRSDLKRKSAYIAYSNPKGFIYKNKEKKNRLMRVNELHKFRDGTLNDVRSALHDILKRIRMKYLPQTVWINVDKERAGAMIQAIDQQLRNKRIIRSLEKFVSGRPYEGDIRLLERTI